MPRIVYRRTPDRISVSVSHCSSDTQSLKRKSVGRACSLSLSLTLSLVSAVGSARAARATRSHVRLAGERLEREVHLMQALSRLVRPSGDLALEVAERLSQAVDSGVHLRLSATR